MIRFDSPEMMDFLLRTVIEPAEKAYDMYQCFYVEPESRDSEEARNLRYAALLYSKQLFGMYASALLVSESELADAIRKCRKARDEDTGRFSEFFARVERGEPTEPVIFDFLPRAAYGWTEEKRSDGKAIKSIVSITLYAPDEYRNIKEAHQQ